MNEIEHVGADQDGAKLLEVAVVLIFHLSNTPSVLTSLHDAPVVGLDILLGTDDREGHSSHQATGVGGGMLIILLNGRSVDLNALSFDNSTDLPSVSQEVFP